MSPEQQLSEEMRRQLEQVEGDIIDAAAAFTSDEPASEIQTEVLQDQSVEIFPISESEKVEQKKYDFEKTFNISKEELEKTPNWSVLSEGQRALVFENLQQLTLRDIQEEAIDKYTQKKSAGNWAAGMWRGMFKKYYVAQEQKATAAEIQKGGLAVHGEIFNKLVEAVKIFGPAVDLKENGKLEILYAGRAADYAQGLSGGKVELSAEDKDKLDNFNAIATKFSRLPYEFSLSTATKKQRVEFEQARSAYEEAIGDIIKLKEEQLGNEREAALKIKEIDYQVRMNQFLNTHPEAEKKLLEIKSNEVWSRALNSTIFERGGYMGFGFGARIASTAFIGYAVAPLFAAVTAGHLAYRRAKEAITETEQAARRGVKQGEGKKISKLQPELKAVKEQLKEIYQQLGDKTQELGIENFDPFKKSSIDKLREGFEGELPDGVANLVNNLHTSLQNVGRIEEMIREERAKAPQKEFANAASLQDKIFKLTNKIEETENEEEKAKLRGQLEARLNYTKEKIDKGEINFGSGKERLANQYALLYLFGQGEALAASGRAEVTMDEEGRTLEERLDNFLSLREKNISKGQRKSIIKQVIVGGVIGAGFAALGSAIADYFRGGSHTAEAAKEHQVSSGKQPLVIKGEAQTSVGASENTSNVTQAETIKHAQELDTLSKKFGLNLKELSDQGLSSPKDTVDYLHNLENNFNNIKVGGATLTPEQIHDFVTNHPEMFKGGKVPSLDDINIRLKTDLDITTIKAGEGIETKGLQQILDNPKKFGFTGDIDNKVEVQAFANKLAHEAALNTKVGGTTVVGEDYDLRLKGSAIDKEIYLKQGSDGKWHYEFSKNLDQGDIYEHAIEIPANQEVIEPKDIAWAPKGAHITEITAHNAPEGFEPSSEVHLYEIDSDGDGVGDYYTVGDKNEIFHTYSQLPNKTGEEFLERAVAVHHEIAATVKAVTRALGENAKDWATGDKFNAARALAFTYDGADNLSESSKMVLYEVIDKFGSKAPTYLHDQDLGIYIRDNISDLTQTKVESLYNAGAKLHESGWKSIDYNFLKKLIDSPRPWKIDGQFLETNLKSPLSGNKIIEDLQGERFNEEVVAKAFGRAVADHAKLGTTLTQLRDSFEGGGIKALTHLNNGTVEKIMHTDASLSLEQWKSNFGGGFKNGTVEAVYKQLNQALSGKLSQGGLQGTVGENLEKVVLHSSTPKLSNVEISVKSQEPINLTNSDVPKPTGFEQVGEKAHTVIQETSTPPKLPPETIKSSAEPIKIVETPKTAKAPIYESSKSSAPAKGLSAEEAPNKLGSKQPSIEQIISRKADVFGELGNTNRAFELLHNSKATYAEQMEAIKTLGLKNGEAINFKNNIDGADEGLLFNNGKYYYRLGTNVQELTPEIAGKIGKVFSASEVGAKTIEVVTEPPKPPSSELAQLPKFNWAEGQKVGEHTIRFAYDKANNITGFSIDEKPITPQIVKDVFESMQKLNLPAGSKELENVKFIYEHLPKGK